MISAERMKSVRIAPETMLLLGVARRTREASGWCS